MKSNRFYLANGTLGLNVVFWAKDGHGYTTDLDKAHAYSHKEMQEKVDQGWLRVNEEFPLCADIVDKLSVLRVDMQCVNKVCEQDLTDKELYYGARKQIYSGNDIRLFNGVTFSFDAGKALPYPRDFFQSFDAEHVDLFTQKEISQAKRRTFPYRMINKRKMILGAGIVGVRKKRVYKNSGKTRWNCPVCGKISWQYDPHYFNGCNDVSCDGFRSNYE